MATLVGYSQDNIPIFKYNQLEPVKDLKLLIKDYAPIAKNAFTILINISSDTEILKVLAKDDAFLEALLSRITVCQFPTDRRGRVQEVDGVLEPQRVECERDRDAPRQYGKGRLTTASA
jgi:hypothetical protein